MEIHCWDLEGLYQVLSKFIGSSVGIYKEPSLCFG